MGKRYLKASYKKKQGKNKKNKLVLTWFSSYIKLPESITKKKVVINKKNNDEECFKQKVRAELFYKEIGNKPEYILKLQHYDDQYNWNGFEFPLAIQIIDNPGIAVNVLFNSKNGTYTPQVLKNIVASKSTYS